MPDTSVRKISMRVDAKLDAQLSELQQALNLNMSAVICLAVATLHTQAQREGWLVKQTHRLDKLPAE